MRDAPSTKARSHRSVPPKTQPSGLHLHPSTARDDGADNLSHGVDILIDMDNAEMDGDNLQDQPGDPPGVAEEPEEVVAQAAIDADQAKPAKGRRTRAPAVERPYPRRSMEDALRVPRALKDNNGGNPWPPTEVAKSLGGGMGSSFFYLTAASRDFGFTEGTRDATTISLTELGRRAVYPTSTEAELEAKREAFDSVDIFKRVVDYYGGSALPKDEFLRNTLEATFGLDPRVHDEFVDLFRKNCRFVGIGAEVTPVVEQTTTRDTKIALTPAAPDSGRAGNPVCFVIMPFVERTDVYATGFFEEVFASLFKPAIEAAGFTARTARRQGSDVIHSTIVNELIDADLVLADLTEHNPNVLFELGVRMAIEKPIALLRAKGTGPIFDVDNMLRVESYNPNLWLSTVEKDIPRITAHIEAAWSGRDTDTPFMKLLRQR